MLPFDQVVLVENSYMLASCSKSSGCIIHARRRKNIYTDVIATVIRHLQGWLLNTIIVYQPAAMTHSCSTTHFKCQLKFYFCSLPVHLQLVIIFDSSEKSTFHEEAAEKLPFVF